MGKGRSRYNPIPGFVRDPAPAQPPPARLLTHITRPVRPFTEASAAPLSFQGASARVRRERHRERQAKYRDRIRKQEREVSENLGRSARWKVKGDGN